MAALGKDAERQHGKATTIITAKHSLHVAYATQLPEIGKMKALYFNPMTLPAARIPNGVQYVELNIQYSMVNF